MKSNKFKLTLITLIFLFLTGNIFANCQKLIADIINNRASEEVRYINVDRYSAEQLTKQVISNYHLPKLEFSNLDSDTSVIKFMKGEDFPKLFRTSVPNGVKLIAKPLADANEPGVVKYASGGSTVSTKLFFKHNGKKTSTNASFLIDSYMDNLVREKKSIIRENAKAVIVVMHGGGTRTTGHHVFINMTNYLKKFGIDVVSIDLPYHAEGPRDLGTDAKETLEWVRSFTKEFILPANRPVFLTGHSMGGQLSALYLQFFKKADVFDGVMPLSPPIDMAPGKSAIEKLDAQEKFWKEVAENGSDATSEDEDVLGGILVNGKSNPYGSQLSEGWSTQLDMEYNKSESYLPSLWIGGEYDFLYKDGDMISKFEKMIEGLPNSELLIYKGKFPSIMDPTNTHVVDHFIFEHGRKGETDPKTIQPALFLDMIDFMFGKVMKKEIPKANKEKEKLDKLGFIKLMLKEYVNVLSFREFAKEYKFYFWKIKDPKKLGLMSRDYSQITKKLMTVQGVLKAQTTLVQALKKSTPEEVVELLPILGDASTLQRDLNSRKPFLDKASNEYQQQLKQIESRRKGVFVPKGEAHQDDRHTLFKFNDIQDLIHEENKELRDLRHGHNKLLKQLKQFDHIVDLEVSRLIKESQDQIVINIADRYNDAYRVFLSEDTKLNLKMDKELKIAIKKNNGSMPNDYRPSRELQRQVERFYDTHYKEFKKEKDLYELNIRRYILQGRYKRDGKLSNINKKNHESLLKSIEKIEVAQSYLQNSIYNLEKESDHIRKNLIQKYNNDIWEFQEFRLIDLLNSPFEDIDTVIRPLEEAWGAWKKRWKERPEVTGGSMY